MKTIFIPPYGEELQITVVDGIVRVSSDINVLLNLNKKVQDVHQAENIIARLRELPQVGDSPVDLSSDSSAPSRFFDSLSDRLEAAKSELRKLDADEKKFKESADKKAAFERVQALKKKLGLD